MIHRGTHRVVAVPDGERVDHGARGPANQARPHRLLETIAAGVQLRQYGDCHLIDRMHTARQISDREYAAASIAAIMHDEAGFQPNTTAGYTPAGARTNHSDDLDEAVCVTRFRALLAGNGGGELSPVGAWLVHGLCLGQHPGPQRIGTLRCALSGLARRWGC